MNTLKSFGGLILGMILVVMFLPCNQLSAQPEDANIGIEIAPMFGYMFGGKLRGYDGELNVGDGFTYGIRASKAVGPGTWVEFSWNGMHTDARLRDYYSPEYDQFFDMDVNYYLLSYLQYWQVGIENVHPFGIMGVGASSHKLTKTSGDRFGDDTEWFFSASFGLGAKIFLNQRIGIRLQGRMLMPITWGGVNLWCGTGGCGGGVYTTSSILQGDLSGGLIFRF